MATLYISVYQVAQAQWSLDGLLLNASQNNLSIAPYSFADKRIYFHNNNYFLEFPGFYNTAMSYGYNITLDNISRFYICPPGLAQKTTIEEAGNAIVQIGNPINNTTVQINGNIELKSLKFLDNTTLNSANFITSIAGLYQTTTGLNNRIGVLAGQIAQLNVPQLTATYTGLSLNGKLKITDGTQGEGKVLKSNATGTASWQNANEFANGIALQTFIQKQMYNHKFTVYLGPTKGCSTFVAPSESSEFNFPKPSPEFGCSTITTTTPVTVPSLVGTGRVYMDPPNGLALEYAAGNAITITPQGGIKFKDGSVLNTAIQWTNITNGINYTSNVGIGTFESISEKLEINGNLRVHGKIAAKRVTVSSNATFPDYVFDKSYIPLSIELTEEFIHKNHHLPELEKGEKYETEGIDISEMLIIQTKKIEELTLWLIEQNKKIKALEAKQK